MHQMPQGIPGESVEARGRRQLDVAHESTVAEQPLVGIWQCGAVEEADIDMCRERIDVTQRDSLHADRGMAVMQACMDIGTSGGPCLQPDFREILQFDGTTTCEPIRDIGGGGRAPSSGKRRAVFIARPWGCRRRWSSTASVPAAE